MIVKDGAETLERCLVSIAPYVHEIVIGIDSRTTDETREIAEKYHAKVFEFTWTDDFAAARNLVADQVSTEWILVVDADDRLSEINGPIIPSSDYNGANVTVQTSETTRLYSTRIYRKGDARYVGRVHEVLRFASPNIVTLPVVIAHERGTKTDPERNVRILGKTIDEYPRYLFYYGRENIDLGKYEEGIKSLLIYLQVATWEPERLQAVMDIARAYHHLGKIDEAKKYCFLAIGKNQDYQPAYVMLGKIAYEGQEWGQVVNWCLSALNLRSTHYVFDNSVRDTHLCYDLLSVAYFQLRQYQVGYVYMQKCVEIEPENERMITNMKFYADELAP